MEMIDMILVGWLSLLVIIFIGCIIMLRRNDQVLLIRNRVLDSIKPGTTNFDEMMDRYRTVSYERMLFSFKSAKKLEKELKEIVGLDKR